MYLHKLEKDEKSMFLAFAKYLAKIDDNKIDDREKYMLRYMTMEMGLDPDDKFGSDFDVDRARRVFHRDIAKRILILEGVGVGYSNGELDEEQRSLLHRMARDFMLPENFVERSEAAIRKQLEVMDEFDSLLDAE